MTTTKSLRRQFFNCCVFWGKEYQQNCSCCKHHLPPFSPFHSNRLDWSKVQSWMPYIQPMHGHATPFFTSIFPSGFQTIKKRSPDALHLTLLWTMVILTGWSATGAMSKQRTSLNLIKNSNLWYLEQKHVSCIWQAGQLIALLLPCPSFTHTVALQLFKPSLNWANL